MKRWTPVVVWFVLALASCRRPATQLVVVVESNLAAAPACVLVEATDLQTDTTTSALFFVGAVGVPRASLPFSIGVGTSSPEGRVEIRASALSSCTTEPASGDIVVSRSARSGFLPHQAVRVRVALTSACVGVVCSPTETCDAGRCVPIPLLTPSEVDIIAPGTELTDAGASATDGGNDAGATEDAGCAASPCQLAPPQCGCGAGSGCYSNPAGTAASCLPEGASPIGGRCVAESDCVSGATCLSTPSPTTGNTCARLCTVPSSCARGTECLTVTAPGFPSLGVCQSDCDPLTSVGCPSGRTCFVVQYTSPPWLLQCVDAPGASPEGSGCVGSADCLAHHVCANDTCRHLCVLATGVGCTGGRTCMPSTDGAITIGDTDYGVCVP